MTEFKTPSPGGRERVREVLSDVIGDQPLEFRDISNIEVSGDTATANVDHVDHNLDNVVRRHRMSFVRQGGVWKLDSRLNISPELPEGVTAIDVSMAEFSFSFDASAISNGDIAFRLENVGEQQHALRLFMVPADLDVEKALQSRYPPEGAQDIVLLLGPFDPSDRYNVVFGEPLRVGRYVMLCPLRNDALGSPSHYQLGMLAEFEVK